MAYLYFVVASKEIFSNAIQCHMKNVLVSYFYIPKVGQPNYIKNHVDRLFVDSGAHSAATIGAEIDMYEYYDFLKDNEEQIDVGAHFDVVEKPIISAKNLQIAKEKGLDWILPVLQGHWPSCLSRYNQIDRYDYYGLGGLHMMRRKLGMTLQDACNKMPRKLKYHGFGKVNFELMKKGFLHSADSSSWVSVARYGTVMAYTRNAAWQDGFSVGKRGKDKLDVRRYYELYKDDCEACGISLNGLMAGDYHDTTKFMVACFYRPMLRKLGMFRDNFYE